MLSTVQKLLLAFVTLTVGVLLVGVIAGEVNDVTGVETKTQTVNIGAARLAGTLVTVTNEPPNSTTNGGVINSTGYRVDKGVAAAAAGSFTVTRIIDTDDGSEFTLANGFTWNSSGYVFYNSTGISQFNISYTYGQPAINSSYPFTIGATDFDGWQASHDECSTSALFRTTNVVTKNVTGTTLTEGSCAQSGQWDMTNGVNRVYFCDAVSGASNVTTVTYKYCADDYVGQSWARSTLTLIAGLFSVALLVFAVGMFYSVAKDTGLVS